MNIYCSAPTNAATSNLAERIYKLTITGRQRPLLIIHGYSKQKEISALISMVEGGSQAGDKNKSWEPSLSTAEWLFKAVMRKEYQLEPGDPAQLQQLRTRLGQRDGDSYEHFRNWVDSNGKVNQFPSYKQLTDTITTILSDLVNCADAVCTTPWVSATSPYQQYNQQQVKTVMLDETGAMVQADALLVWGVGCRPCVMGGDPQQLQPTVLSQGIKRAAGEHTTRPFALQMQRSVLERIQIRGFPCFVLNTQNRIVKGGFDVTRQIITPKSRASRMHPVPSPTSAPRQSSWKHEP